MRTALFVLTIAATAACTNSGLGRDASGFHADYERVERTAEEEAGLIDFLNDYEVSTLHVLDDICLIRSDSAQNIDDFRAGPDGHYGNGNDNAFTDEQSVLDIYMVGPWTVDQLYRCAETFGYIAPSCSTAGPWTTEIQDRQTEVPAGVNSVIDDLLATDNCGPSIFAPVLSELWANGEDCDTTGYTATITQMIDPEGGIYYWITAEISFTGTVTSIDCQI